MGRPKKTVEEVTPDTAPVAFWDAPEDTKPAQVNEAFDLEEAYEAVDVSAIVQSSRTLSEDLHGKIEPAKPKEPANLDIRSAFGKPKPYKPINPPVEYVEEVVKKTNSAVESTIDFLGEQNKPGGSVVLDEVAPFTEEQAKKLREAQMPEIIPVTPIDSPMFIGVIDTGKSILQEKAELAALNKSEMTKEQKQKFADLKAQEIVENTKVLDQAITKFKASIDNAPVLDVKYYKDNLDSIRDSRPKFPNEGASPNNIIDTLTNVGRNIERLSTLLGDLTYVFNLYEGMIDTIEDMWSTVSLQSSEQTRRGEGALQISDVKIQHNEVRGLKAAYNIELETLKQIKDTCAELIKLIQIQIRLNEPVITGNEFDGIGR